MRAKLQVLNSKISDYTSLIIIGCNSLKGLHSFFRRYVTLLVRKQALYEIILIGKLQNYIHTYTFAFISFIFKAL